MGSIAARHRSVALWLYGRPCRSWGATKVFHDLAAQLQRHRKVDFVGNLSALLGPALKRFVAEAVSGAQQLPRDRKALSTSTRSEIKHVISPQEWLNKDSMIFYLFLGGSIRGRAAPIC